MQALLLVDHGSRRSSANENLLLAADAIRQQAPGLLVHIAHMELAEPDIESGFAACVSDGATEIVVFPWFLASGRHVQADIPRLCKAAQEANGGVAFRIAPPFGVDAMMAEVALRRAKLED